MKQIRFTSDSFIQEQDASIPDAVLDPDDMAQLYGTKKNSTVTAPKPQELSKAHQRAIAQREQNIKPGTSEWFKLWFSR